MDAEQETIPSYGANFSTPLSVALLAMLRYMARLSPIPVAMSAALAVAAITAAALSLVHPLDASAMILLWNIGVALIFVAGGSLFGHRLPNWVTRA